MRHGCSERRAVERQVNTLAREGIKETCRVSNKQNAIVLWTRRALCHRSRHQELFGTHRLGKTLPQFRVCLHRLSHKALGRVRRCCQTCRVHDHAHVDEYITYRGKTDVSRRDQKHFSPGPQGLYPSIVRHQSHVFEPTDMPHQAEPTCQGRVQSVRGNHQPGTYSDMSVCVQSLYAGNPPALEEQLPHPQASTQFYTLPTRLLHQEMVQYQPRQRQAVEALALVHKTSPARTATIISHAHALQALR